MDNTEIQRRAAFLRDPANVVVPGHEIERAKSIGLEVVGFKDPGRVCAWVVSPDTATRIREVLA